MPRTPNTRLRLLLEAAGWNQRQLAYAIRNIAAEHGVHMACDRSTVSHWLAGTHPRSPAASLLLEVLARRLARPISAQEAGLTQALAAIPDLSWEVSPLRILARLTATELDPIRRRLLSAGVFSLAALTLPEPLPPSGHARPTPPSTGARRAGGAEAEQMRAMATLFASAAESHGGGSVRAALAAYLAHDATTYLHAPATEWVHLQLLSAAAQLTLLLGRMCVDSGHHATAQRYHHTAARLASDAGDTAMIAIALRTLSTHAHDLGHHGPAVLNLAQRAVDQARGNSPAIQTYTQAHLAVLEAHHDRHAALTALARAEHSHERTISAPGPFTAYPPGALHYQRARTLAALGDRTGALGALTASIRMRTPSEHRASTLSYAHLAESHLRLGHLEEALPHWQTFLDHYPQIRSVVTTAHLNTMRRLLQAHRRHPAVAALLARAATLI